MEKAALEKLESLIIAAHDQVETLVPIYAMPEGARFEDLEKFGGAPLFMRAQYTTERISDYVAYLASENQQGNTSVFVDPDGSGSEAVIDMGNHDNPQWARHRATLEMKHTSEFQALLDASNATHCQRGLVEFLEDNAHVIQSYAGDEAISIGQAISAIRKVDIAATANAGFEENDFQRKRTHMEEIEAKSKGGKLPTRIEFKTAPFVETESRTINVRIYLHTGGQEPAFKIRIVAREHMLREVADEIELRLREKLDSVVPVYVGHISRK